MEAPARIVVTEPRDAPRARASAVEAAARQGLPYAPREGRPLEAVARAAGADVLLVAGPRRVALWAGGHEQAWDPGMGALRAKRLRAGEGTTVDGLLEAAGVRAGDRVLDCTLGLGADALVLAVAAGEGGEVVGLEASRAIAALTAEGFLRSEDPAARRVRVVHADAGAWLADQPAASFDLVLFDPMFRHARAQPPGFDLVRRFADARPLAPETLAEARRVARRAVVVKDGTPGWDLARLGLRPLPSARGAHRLYARVDAL